MGAPRAKNGSNTSRPIISMHRNIVFSNSFTTPSYDLKEIEEVTSVFSDESTTMDQFNNENHFFIPLRRASKEDTIDESFGNERINEIYRQKEIIMRAYTNQIEELLEFSPFSPDKSITLARASCSISISRQLSPWKNCQTPSSNHIFRTLSHIHDSSEAPVRTPCRNDYIYACEKHSTSGGSNSYSPFGTISLGLHLSLYILPLPMSLYSTLVWEESEDRHNIILKEERQRQRFYGNEISEFLSLQREIRTNPQFHLTNSSSLHSLRLKEAKYLHELNTDRVKRNEKEHKQFMCKLPPIPLPPLKLPSITSTGRPYKCNSIDYAVAKAVAVEKKIWNVCGGDRKKSTMYFPTLL